MNNEEGEIEAVKEENEFKEEAIRKGKRLGLDYGYDLSKSGFHRSHC